MPQQLPASREDPRPIRNYQDWLHVAFGEVFAETFPAAYTRKYWTVEPSMLSTDWVGNRVLKPSVEEVKTGASGPLGLHGPHYHHGKEIRYPRRGGFMAYTHKMAEKATVRFNTPVVQVNFGARSLRLKNGSTATYDHLIRRGQVVGPNKHGRKLLEAQRSGWMHGHSSRGVRFRVSPVPLRS